MVSKCSSGFPEWLRAGRPGSVESKQLKYLLRQNQRTMGYDNYLSIPSPPAFETAATRGGFPTLYM